MKLAACNEMLAGKTWEEACATISAHGYQGVEIAPFTLAPTVREVSATQREHLQAVAREHGLEIVGLHWLLAKTEGFYLTHPERSVRQLTAAYFSDLVRFCSEIGGKVLVLGSPLQRNLLPGVGWDEAMSYAADTLQEPSHIASGEGVAIAIEPLNPYDTNFINTAAQARTLIELVDQPGCRLHLDARAMAYEHRPMAEIVHANADILAHVHVNDVNNLGPGMGAVDLAPMIAALRQVAYTGFLSVEVFDTTPGPAEILAKSRAYLERLLVA